MVSGTLTKTFCRNRVDPSWPTARTKHLSLVGDKSSSDANGAVRLSAELRTATSTVPSPWADHMRRCRDWDAGTAEALHLTFRPSVDPGTGMHDRRSRDGGAQM